MAYIYHLSFDIEADKVDELRIGRSLGRVIEFMRTMLPSHSGFITSRAAYSLTIPDKVNVIFQSVWEQWEDVERHQQSEINTEKALEEFEPHISREEITVNIYSEVD